MKLTAAVGALPVQRFNYTLLITILPGGAERGDHGIIIQKTTPHPIHPPSSPHLKKG